MKFKRTIAAFVVCILMLVCFAAYAEGIFYNAYAQEVVRQVNMEREKRGLNPLRIDSNLTAAANIRAKEITEKFSHTRPNGSRAVTVSDFAYAENIARGQKTPDKVMAAWLTSDGHRQNMLRESYGSIGVSCIRAGNVYYWVQLFGK
ncbi:MAG: hypothetical protein IJA26_07135 [Clostridia bacterium]|nr:hypothetical protein [Clostridia bacterium]